MTLNELKERLEYNPRTGVFTWLKVGYNKHRKLGKVAGSLTTKGYVGIKVGGRQYEGHRLAWYFTHNKWPHCIDHINRIRFDNRIDNLREVTYSQNAQNYKFRKGKPVRGTCYIKSRNKWKATLIHNGKNVYIGNFHTEQEAHEAYVKKAIELRGEYTHFIDNRPH